jgi:methylated-DNA-[protein]-cysteine S-methyltransferase
MAVSWYGIVDGEPRAVGSMMSPWGDCTVTACREGIISIDWAGESKRGLSPSASMHSDESAAREMSDNSHITAMKHVDATNHMTGVASPAEAQAKAEAHTEATISTEDIVRAVQIVEDSLDQLEQYFSGTRHTFTLPLVLRGTAFQKAVWEYLLTIPYAETRSYGDVARAIGRDKAVRAVGQANRANPIPIVIPCHRVIGQTGALTGYAGSQVHLKAALLSLEQDHRLIQSGA